MVDVEIPDAFRQYINGVISPRYALISGTGEVWPNPLILYGS